MMLSHANLATLVASLLALAGITQGYFSGTGRPHERKQGRATVTLVDTPAGRACEELSSMVSTSFAPATSFFSRILHAASNAQDTPTCVVEPETPEEVGQILRVVGEYRAPFAVQSGGHAQNPKFSSTEGVHISLARFNDVTLSDDGLTVDVGSGQTWGEVYQKLEGTGRIVVGGRVANVGVGGFLMYGGGYSYHSNQYGLGVDLIQRYTLVFPDGTVKYVTSASDGKLFNALKGTGNNFGIVTSFRLKTVPMPAQVWGGKIIYLEDKFEQLSSIIASFSSDNLDPKAVILPSFTAAYNQGIAIVVIQFFYDGPSPPPGTFDAFLDVPCYQNDVKARSFLDLLATNPSEGSQGLRSYFQSIPVKAYTPTLVKAFADIASEYNAQGVIQTGVIVAATVEPFTAGAFAAASGREAFAHDEEHACLPSLVTVNWVSPLSDTFWQQAAEDIVARLTAVAVAEGQDLSDCPYYPNYSLFNTPLYKMYLDKVRPLRSMRRSIDPSNVMRLAGGFKL